jgi:hypothetical protein
LIVAAPGSGKTALTSSTAALLVSNLYETTPATQIYPIVQVEADGVGIEQNDNKNDKKNGQKDNFRQTNPIPVSTHHLTPPPTSSKVFALSFSVASANELKQRIFLSICQDVYQQIYGTFFCDITKAICIDYFLSYLSLSEHLRNNLFEPGIYDHLNNFYPKNPLEKNNLVQNEIEKIKNFGDIFDFEKDFDSYVELNDYFLKISKFPNILQAEQLKLEITREMYYDHVVCGMGFDNDGDADGDGKNDKYDEKKGDKKSDKKSDPKNHTTENKPKKRTEVTLSDRIRQRYLDIVWLYKAFMYDKFDLKFGLNSGTNFLTNFSSNNLNNLNNFSTKNNNQNKKLTTKTAIKSPQLPPADKKRPDLDMDESRLKFLDADSDRKERMVEIKKKRSKLVPKYNKITLKILELSMFKFRNHIHISTLHSCAYSIINKHIIELRLPRFQIQGNPFMIFISCIIKLLLWKFSIFQKHLEKMITFFVQIQENVLQKKLILGKEKNFGDKKSMNDYDDYDDYYDNIIDDSNTISPAIILANAIGFDFKNDGNNIQSNIQNGEKNCEKKEHFEQFYKILNKIANNFRQAPSIYTSHYENGTLTSSSTANNHEESRKDINYGYLHRVSPHKNPE